MDFEEREERPQLCTLEGDMVFGSITPQGEEHMELHRNPAAMLRLVWQPLHASVSSKISI